MIKQISLLLLFSSVCFASIPIRDNNGCFVGSKGVTYDGIKEDTIATIPFYLVSGKDFIDITIYDFKCPFLIKEITEIKIPLSGKIVGHLEQVFNDVYITVPTKNEVKYFPTRDVFIESTQEWSFKDLRGGN